MKKVLLAALLALAPTLGLAQDSSITGLPLNGAIGGTEPLPIDQGGVTKKVTISGLLGATTGDCTFSGLTITCTKTNGTAFSALATTTPGTGVAGALAVNVGSAGAFVVLGGAGGTPSSLTLTNATGLPTSGIANGALPAGVTINNGNWSGAVLTVANGGTGTATPSLVAGTNVTISGTWPNQTINSSGGGSSTLTANSNATSGYSANQIVYSDGAKIQAGTVSTGLSFSGGSLTNSGVLSITTSCPSAGPSTGAVTIAASSGAATDSTTTPPYTAAICGGTYYATNAAAKETTMPVASTSGYGSGNFWEFCNRGAGAWTIKATTSTVGGITGSTGWVLGGGSAASPSCVVLESNGTDYNVKTPTGDMARANGLLAVANGGTGTASPGLVAGTNVTISGSWPNQTINASGGGGWTNPYDLPNGAATFTADNQLQFFKGTQPDWTTYKGFAIGTGSAGPASVMSVNGQAMLYADTGYGLILQGRPSVSILSPSGNVICGFGSGGMDCYHVLVDSTLKFATTAGGYVTAVTTNGSNNGGGITVGASGPFGSSAPTPVGSSSGGFQITVAASPSGTDGVLTFGTAAGTGYACDLRDITDTTKTITMNATSRSTTVQHFTFSATPTAGDVIVGHCWGY